MARATLARLESEERDRRDIEIIDRDADRLNREAVDTLEYQRCCEADAGLLAT